MPLSHIVVYPIKFDRGSVLPGQGEVLLDINRQLALWWGSVVIRMKALVTKEWNVLGRQVHLQVTCYLNGKLAWGHESFGLTAGHELESCGGYGPVTETLEASVSSSVKWAKHSTHLTGS